MLAVSSKYVECCDCDGHVNKAMAGHFNPSHLSLISGSGCRRVNSFSRWTGIVGGCGMLVNGDVIVNKLD